jgi:hypothetical protein
MMIAEAGFGGGKNASKNNLVGRSQKSIAALSIGCSLFGSERRSGCSQLRMRAIRDHTGCGYRAASSVRLLIVRRLPARRRRRLARIERQHGAKEALTEAAEGINAAFDAFEAGLSNYAPKPNARAARKIVRPLNKTLS